VVHYGDSRSLKLVPVESLYAICNYVYSEMLLVENCFFFAVFTHQNLVLKPTHGSSLRALVWNLMFKKTESVDYPQNIHDPTVIRSDSIPACDRQTDRQTDRPIAHSWVMHMHSKNVLHHWSTVQRKSAERQYLLGDDSATHNTTSTVFWRQIHTQIWTLHRHTYHDQLFLNMYQHF